MYYQILTHSVNIIVKYQVPTTVFSFAYHTMCQLNVIYELSIGQYSLSALAIYSYTLKSILLTTIISEYCYFYSNCRY